MHVKVRCFGKADTIVAVQSKLTKIEQFRKNIEQKFNVPPKSQRLFYGGRVLEDGYTFYDYNIKLNDVIQLVVKLESEAESEDKQIEDQTGQLKISSSAENIVEYKDATSKLYEVGDLIDMKDRLHGAWYEGKIVKIVYNPKVLNNSAQEVLKHQTSSSSDTESDLENKNQNVIATSKSKNKNGIQKYFFKIESVPKKKQDDNCQIKSEEDLLFNVELDGNDNEESNVFCKYNEIRPRARNVLDPKTLTPGQTVMVNHNTELPSEKGLWYDFKLTEVKELRKSYELLGTLYLGPESIPQNDTLIKVVDKIYAIEEIVPIDRRTKEYKTLMSNSVEKRSEPLNCLTCRDDENENCKDCGCNVCGGKEQPNQIVLCDECNLGYHINCLSPALMEVPDEDWYCPDCKRNPMEIIAPGASKQPKKIKAVKNSRDWGRGMACVGKTKTCDMPANHFGPIPGIEVGMCWRFRIQLSESGVHRPPVSGIHGRDVEGAYSIVLSGGYEDDVDKGYEFSYTGSGGRDLSGNKRTAEQSCDQTLTRENRALARNCAVNTISEKGGDAGDNWREGKPVRVVRSYKMLKHFPKYAPKEGIRYDGIYKVVKYYPEKGLSGFIVWKYLLRRDDPTPAPWEPNAKQYPIVYPDGYLEAEAEKKALKEKTAKKSTTGKRKKRRKVSSDSSDSIDLDDSPPSKKLRTRHSSKPKASSVPKANIPDMFIKSPKASKKSIDGSIEKVEQGLTAKEKEAIAADSLNEKLWNECYQVYEVRGRKEFVEFVMQTFLCIICQEIVATPITTPCAHNFCMACLKQAFKSTGTFCPCCRNKFADYQPEVNKQLQLALRTILPGYDAGKK